MIIASRGRTRLLVASPSLEYILASWTINISRQTPQTDSQKVIHVESGLPATIPVRAASSVDGCSCCRRANQS